MWGPVVPVGEEASSAVISVREKYRKYRKLVKEKRRIRQPRAFYA
jgi:hypothetical protein